MAVIGSDKSMRGNSLLETRKKNRILIKKCIFYGENPTRADIARELGLTNATITTSVQELADAGLVEEIPLPVKNSSAPGRRPRIVRFRRDAGYAIGIELAPYELCGVMMDAGGSVRKSVHRPVASAHYDLMMGQLESLILELLEDEVHPLLGIGVGIPGVVDMRTGLVRRANHHDWSGRYLRRDLNGRINIDTITDNNVQMRARGYSMDKHDIGETTAYFFLSRGIACPILVNEKIISGNGNAAGELGQMVLNDRPEGWQTAESVVSFESILGHCREAMRAGRMKNLASMCRSPESLTMQMVLACEDQGDPEVEEVIFHALRYAGAALANVVNLINPGKVVVDSQLLQSRKNQEAFRVFAQELYYGVNVDEVKMNFLPYQSDRGARGAAYCVLREKLLEA